jgi:uncharacterized protein YqjF (DUF2071 family)
MAMGRAVIGYQRWEDLLFMHWALDEDATERLRLLVPPRLELDLHEGRAYVSMTPFTMTHARLRYTPEVPYFASFHEVNLRTYVKLDGQPGLWFLSLDAASAPAAAVARASMRLPYHAAHITRDRTDGHVRYASERWGGGARFFAEWSAVLDEGTTAADPLEGFLVERYVLYSQAIGRKLWRTQIRHRPWKLYPLAELAVAETLHSAVGLLPLGLMETPRWSPGVDVTFFTPELV